MITIVTTSFMYSLEMFFKAIIIMEYLFLSRASETSNLGNSPDCLLVLLEMMAQVVGIPYPFIAGFASIVLLGYALGRSHSLLLVVCCDGWIECSRFC